MNVSYNRCGNLAEEAKLGTTQFNYNLDPWCACEKKYLVYDQQYIGNKSQLRFGLAFYLDWHIHQVIVTVCHNPSNNFAQIEMLFKGKIRMPIWKALNHSIFLQISIMLPNDDWNKTQKKPQTDQWNKLWVHHYMY